jgi:hypothetical protein
VSISDSGILSIVDSCNVSIVDSCIVSIVDSRKVSIGDSGNVSIVDSCNVFIVDICDMSILDSFYIVSYDHHLGFDMDNIEHVLFVCMYCWPPLNGSCVYLNYIFIINW